MTPEERASIYTDRLVGRHADPNRTEPDQALTQAKDAAAKVLHRNKSLEDRIAARLDGAGSSWKPSEWLLLHSAIFVGSGVVGLLLGKGSLFLGLIFLALGAFGPWMWLGSPALASPQGLQLVAARHAAADVGLAGGRPLAGAVGRHDRPRGHRADLLGVQAGAGRDPARCRPRGLARGVGERFESKDFAWVVMAIKIQRQVGGNLAELLDTVAATMREREYMRRQVAALAAEGKLSAMGPRRSAPGSSCSTCCSRTATTSWCCSPSRWAG